MRLAERERLPDDLRGRLQAEEIAEGFVAAQLVLAQPEHPQPEPDQDDEQGHKLRRPAAETRRTGHRVARRPARPAQASSTAAASKVTPDTIRPRATTRGR